VIIFGVFFVSLVPQSVRLEVGDVSSVNVKAPSEVIDDAATERLRQEKAETVSKVYDNDPKVLVDIRGQIAAFRKAIADTAADPDSSTQEVIQALRAYLADDASDGDIIATVAAGGTVLDQAFVKLDEVVSEPLTLGLKPENLDKAKNEIRDDLLRDPTSPITWLSLWALLSQRIWSRT
jgi:membrane-associated HD superfamily phosphohydrolase